MNSCNQNGGKSIFKLSSDHEIFQGHKNWYAHIQPDTGYTEFQRFHSNSMQINANTMVFTWAENEFK